MAKVFVNKRKVITTTSDVVTEEVVTEAIRLHMSKLVKNYVESEDMYLSQHEVLKMVQAIKLVFQLKSNMRTRT